MFQRVYENSTINECEKNWKLHLVCGSLTIFSLFEIKVCILECQFACFDRFPVYFCVAFCIIPVQPFAISC